MPDEEKLTTTAERLELHNTISLVKSARAKQEAGKPLTKREIAAVADLEKRQSPAAVTGIDPAAVVRMLVLSDPKAVDEDSIRAVFGDAAWTALPDVATAFGVKHATVKHTWRSNGMPGDGKKKIFPMADVLLWWLRREVANVKDRGADQFTDRKREAETKVAEIDARRKQRMLEREEGRFISIDTVRSQWNSALTVLSNDIMAIVRDVMPALCAKCAKEGGPEIERRLRNSMTRVSERSLEEVLPEGVNGYVK